ncbi:MAG: hypothetical protein ACQETE_16410 [Bacteroidota bacterium]
MNWFKFLATFFIILMMSCEKKELQPVNELDYYMQLPDSVYKINVVTNYKNLSVPKSFELSEMNFLIENKYEFQGFDDSFYIRMRQEASTTEIFAKEFEDNFRAVYMEFKGDGGDVLNKEDTINSVIVSNIDSSVYDKVRREVFGNKIMVSDVNYKFIKIEYDSVFVKFDGNYESVDFFKSIRFQ